MGDSVIKRLKPREETASDPGLGRAAGMIEDRSPQSRLVDQEG